MNSLKKYFLSHELADVVLMKLENIDKELWKVKTNPPRQITVKDFFPKSQYVCMYYGLNFKSK